MIGDHSAVGYVEAIKAISETPIITCAYRLAWPEDDCIKVIGAVLKRQGKTGWDLYQPTQDDLVAEDWIVLSNRCAR